MLRTSNTVPTVSSFAHLYGHYSYDTNPFAPLRTEVEMHIMPGPCKSWAAHTKKGYYVGNSLKHYICHIVWIKETRSVRVSQTVFFKHKYLTMPSLTPADALMRASENLVKALNGLIPTTG